MAMMSRVGLRQLLVLLVVLSLLVAAGNMFWASSSLHQQALLEHDLQQQQRFARQLAGRLEAGWQQDDMARAFDGMMLDEHLLIRVIAANGTVLYPAGAGLAASQERMLTSRQTSLLTDEQGLSQMISVAAVPGSELLLLVQTPVAGHPGVQPALSELLLYSLPAGFLLIVLAWLAGGRLARPFRALAGYARSLNRQDSIAGIEAVEASSKEAAELKSGLLQGAGQFKSRPSGKDGIEDHIDPLTGLSTADILPELVTNISLGDMSFAAVVLAVDDYEQVCEHFAPDLRNQALKQLAELLLQYSRELDISVRLGEEVFLLLLPQCPLVIAQRIAERLRGKVEESPIAGMGHMTISAGVAVYQPGNGEPLATLKQAQQLLIQARREGQNRVHVIP